MLRQRLSRATLRTELSSHPRQVTRGLDNRRRLTPARCAGKTFDDKQSSIVLHSDMFWEEFGRVQCVHI